MNVTQVNKEKAILFLHGFGYNSIQFRESISSVIRTFEDKFPEHRLLIPDAPHILNSLENNIKENEGLIQRGWLYINPENKVDSTDFLTKKEVEYIGFQETIALLKGIARSNQIEAIFGFSQGSFLSLFISIMIELDQDYREAFKDLKCLILSAGFLDPYPTNKELIFDKNIMQSILVNKKDAAVKSDKDKISIGIPMLNVIGIRDEIIKKEKSENIGHLFKESKIMYHEGDHIVPCSVNEIKNYVKFFEKYLK